MHARIEVPPQPAVLGTIVPSSSLPQGGAGRCSMSGSSVTASYGGSKVNLECLNLHRTSGAAYGGGLYILFCCTYYSETNPWLAAYGSTSCNAREQPLGVGGEMPHCAGSNGRWPSGSRLALCGSRLMRFHGVSLKRNLTNHDRFCQGSSIVISGTQRYSRYILANFPPLCRCFGVVISEVSRFWRRSL